MKKTWKKVLAAGLAAVMCMSLFTGCSAKEKPYPSETITLIVPSSAGGGTDLTARLWAKYASDMLGQQVVVSNVTGGGGSTGTKTVYDAKADGYTLLFYHNTTILNKLAGLSTYDHTGFEVGPNFLYDAPCCVFVRADNPYGWTTFEDVVKTAKEKPGELTVATEVGSTTYYQYLATEKATDAKFAIVDGGSNSEKIPGLLGGAFDIMLNAYSTAGSYVDSGDFLCLGVPTEERCEQFPDVPTFLEQGYDIVCPGYQFTLFAPKGTPENVMKVIDETTKKICEDPKAAEEMEKVGYVVEYIAPDENLKMYDEMIKSYEALQ